jgi:spermidine/putrescine transport system ATP-binding protein
MLGDSGIEGTVARAVYLGSDLHLFVTPSAGGPDVRVTTRDGAGIAEGTRVQLSHDPARVHVLEGV